MSAFGKATITRYNVLLEEPHGVAGQWVPSVPFEEAVGLVARQGKLEHCDSRLDAYGSAQTPNHS